MGKCPYLMFTSDLGVYKKTLSFYTSKVKKYWQKVWDYSTFYIEMNIYKNIFFHFDKYSSQLYRKINLLVFTKTDQPHYLTGVEAWIA